MANEEKKKKKEKKELPFLPKVIIMAIIAILVVVISTGTAFFVASKVQGNKQENKIEREIVNVEQTVFGQTINFGEYTLNLRERTPRYLVVRLFLEVNPGLRPREIDNLTNEIANKRIILEDRLLSIMMSKSIEDLMADDDFSKLRQELAKEVNSILGREYVVNIRFNNWLIQ